MAGYVHVNTHIHTVLLSTLPFSCRSRVKRRTSSNKTQLFPRKTHNWRILASALFSDDMRNKFSLRAKLGRSPEKAQVKSTFEQLLWRWIVLSIGLGVYSATFLPLSFICKVSYQAFCLLFQHSVS